MATRIDSWIWAIRLTKTRSAAGAACRGGHVRLNGSAAKPSATVAIGDRVSVRLGSRERIVEVTGLINKRASATIAAQNYIDHSPPPPPREVFASIPHRDRGAGRPTKRERRELDRFRNSALIVAVAALAAIGLAACGSDDSSDVADASSTPEAGTGPDFERCGGLTTDDVVEVTGVAGLNLVIDNPSTCEWRRGSTAPSVSFNWYRGSPIARERGTEQLRRESTRDYEVDGQSGFIAQHGYICEIGVGWDADFIELSLALTSANGTALKTSDETCAAAKRLTEMVVKGAS